MNILNKIVENLNRKYESLWKGFDVDKNISNILSNKDARKPIIPSILQRQPDISQEMFLIAEIKKASPSQGIIKDSFNPVEIAMLYQKCKVDALSILTEEDHFMGSIEYLKAIRQAVPTLPLLRKDFIIHPYQVKESYDTGADMVLLIVAILSDSMLSFLYNYILDFGMTPLVEVHTLEELERAKKLQPKILGINNRDLRSFKIDLNISLKLAKLVGTESKIISESGIFNELDVAMLRANGVLGILVGQSILESDNPLLLINRLKLKGG